MLTLDWGIIWTVVNILILFVLLRIFLFKPVMCMIENRQAMIRNQLDDAENKNREADELKGRYEESLKNAKEESFQIVNDAKERAKVQYAHIIDKANEDAAQIKQQADKSAEADREQMMREAQAELAQVALAAASKLIGSSVDAEANKNMLDQFLSEEGSQK